MNKPGTVVNISGKSYIINKNIKKGALLTIINKLQTDLSQIKYLTQDGEKNDSTQIISDSDLHHLNPKLSVLTASSSPNSNTNQELKARLKKNYEEKVQNLIKLYEQKLQEYKEKNQFLKEDRESYVETLQSKQSIISAQKIELQEVVNLRQELEEKHLAEITDLQQSHLAEITKLRQELEVSKTCCSDLKQVKNVLEKNNQMMKSKIFDTQVDCQRKIEKLAEEYEAEKQKYKTEVRQIRSAIGLIEKQAETKITEIEDSVSATEKTYEAEIAVLQQEILKLRQELKEVDEWKQKLQVEKRSYEATLANTNNYYETKVNNLNICAKKEHEQYLQELEDLKQRYEKQFSKLEEEYVTLEKDVEMKKKEFLECETLKKQMIHEILDLKAEIEASENKHAEECELLKQNYETGKHNSEAEIEKLKGLLLDKEKLADDLDIANKKYEKQYNSLKATIKQIKEEAEEDTSKMTERLKNEKSIFQDEVAKLKEEYSARNKKLEAELFKVKYDNISYLDEIDKLESIRRNLEKTNQDLHQRLDGAFEEHKEAIDRIHRESGIKYDEYETKIEELNAEIAKHQKSIFQLEEMNKMLQTTNEEYRIINAESASKYTADINRIREELQMTRRFHQDDMTSIQKQLDLKEQVEKEKEDRIQKLKLQITEIKTAQTVGYDEKVDRLEKARNELETENTILKHRLADFTDDFKMQKDSFEASQERLKKRFEEETISLKHENQKLLDSIETLERTISDQEKESKLLRKNLDDFSKRQSDESVELAENLSRMRQKYEEKVLKLKTELDTNRKNYEMDLEKARNDFHENRQQYEERIQELKIECNARRELHQELETAKQQLEHHYRILQSDEFKKLAFLGVMGKLNLTEN